MSKKLILACMALVALAAFTLPAMASAVTDVRVTHPTGTLMGTHNPLKTCSEEATAASKAQTSG